MSLGTSLLIKSLNSNNPKIRELSLNFFYTVKPKKLSNTQIKKLLSIASKSLENDDDFSYDIIRYLVPFLNEQHTDDIFYNFDSFSNKAKSRALDILLHIHNQKSISYALHLMDKYKNNHNIHFPLHYFDLLEVYEKEAVPLLCHFILNDFHPQYGTLQLHRIITSSDYLDNIIKEKMIEYILNSIHILMNQYNSYHEFYESSFVYRFWYEDYFLIRTEIIALIHLMKFFHNDKSISTLKQMLDFKDPLIKSSAVSLLLSLGHQIDFKNIEECAENIESRLFFKEELEMYDIKNTYPSHLDQNERFIDSELVIYLFIQNKISDIPKINTELYYHTKETIQFICTLQIDSKTVQYLTPIYSHNLRFKYSDFILHTPE